MTNNARFFTKIKEVNIEINTGNKNKRFKAVAMGNTYMKDNNGTLLKLTDVLFTPDLTRSLVSLNRLFNKNSSITKMKNNFVVNLDDILFFFWIDSQ